MKGRSSSTSLSSAHECRSRRFGALAGFLVGGYGDEAEGLSNARSSCVGSSRPSTAPSTAAAGGWRPGALLSVPAE